ncbi:hypothetical protein B9Z55_003534 [Caenorhabditis nigoni]|nr:hypothetical protein B9Z55_003534 [Caenorhabditis nigoni]
MQASKTNVSESNSISPDAQKSQKSSSEESQIYTRCVNDDSNGSILSNWMDSDVEESNSQISKFRELVEKNSEYLIQEKEAELRDVNSEYAFDIRNF